MIAIEKYSEDELRKVIDLKRCRQREASLKAQMIEHVRLTAPYILEDMTRVRNQILELESELK